MPNIRAVCYLCHVLTQITRCGDFSKISFQKYLDQVDIEDWSFEKWYTFCSNLICDQEKVSLFIQSFFNQSESLSIKKIARIVHDSIHMCLESGCCLVVLGDNDYPKLLDELINRPLSLCLKGDISQLNRRAIAIVGSRKASNFALQKSYEISKSLVRSGVTIVSGGAYGCDVLAHRGAVDAYVGEASTVVVFAGGLSFLYPKGNSDVFKKVLENGGALITERLWDQQSRPYDFPIRNRIISALCQTTLVMDAGLKSGSMVTAHRALDQGRNVFVLKPKVQNLRSSGINLLIDEGAQFYSSFEELLELI